MGTRLLRKKEEGGNGSVKYKDASSKAMEEQSEKIRNAYIDGRATSKPSDHLLGEETGNAQETPRDEKHGIACSRNRNIPHRTHHCSSE